MHKWWRDEGMKGWRDEGMKGWRDFTKKNKKTALRYEQSINQAKRIETELCQINLMTQENLTEK